LRSFSYETLDSSPSILKRARVNGISEIFDNGTQWEGVTRYPRQKVLEAVPEIVLQFEYILLLSDEPWRIVKHNRRV